MYKSYTSNNNESKSTLLLNNQPTNLTAWNTVFLGKMIVVQLVKNKILL